MRGLSNVLPFRARTLMYLPASELRERACSRMGRYIRYKFSA